MDLLALSTIAGKLVVSSGSAFDSLEGILVRLGPGERYTTTLTDGSFMFYSIPDGDYEVKIAENTLPPDAKLKSAPKAALTVRTRKASAAVEFEIERRPVPEKPIRKIFEQ